MEELYRGSEKPLILLKRIPKGALRQSHELYSISFQN